MSFIEDIGANFPASVGSIPDFASIGGAAGAAGGAAGAAGGAAGMLGGAAKMLGPLSMAATGLGVAGSVLQGVMGFASGMQQARQAKQAAIQASELAGVNTQEALLRGRDTLGRAATLAAASGGGLGGTTTGVLNQIAGKTYFNARMAAYKGITQAEADEYMAKVSKDNAINSLISGGLGAAGQGVSGALTQSFRQSILSSKAAQSGEVDPYAFAQLA